MDRRPRCQDNEVSAEASTGLQNRKWAQPKVQSSFNPTPTAKSKL